MKPQNCRIDFIDRSKGIAILLVILGHCCGSPDSTTNRFILCFHMPLFFFLSGCMAKGIAKNSILSYGYKKVKSLLIPQLVLCALFILNSLMRIIDDGLSISEIQVLIWPWFLPVLLCCILLFILISSIVNINSSIKNEVCLFLVIVGSLMLFSQVHCEQMSKHWYFGHFRIVPMAFLFYVLGNMWYKYSEKKHISIKNKKIKSMLAIMAFAVTFVSSSINIPVLFYENIYGNYFVFFLGAISGIYLVIHISKLLDNSILLKWIGRNSLQFYVWNFSVILVSGHLIRCILSKVCPRFEFIEIPINFIMSVLILGIITILTNRFMPWLYYKKI